MSFLQKIIHIASNAFFSTIPRYHKVKIVKQFQPSYMIYSTYFIQNNKWQSSLQVETLPELDFYKYAVLIIIHIVFICNAKEKKNITLRYICKDKITTWMIPKQTSPATAISWKLRLKVSLIFPTRFLKVGSHWSYMMQ